MPHLKDFLGQLPNFAALSLPQSPHRLEAQTLRAKDSEARAGSPRKG